MTIKLSKQGEKELNEIRAQVDKDFKDLWELLDNNVPEGFTHEDVCGFGANLYVIDKETKTRVYMDEWKLSSDTKNKEND